DHVRHELRVCLRLVPAAHDAEADPRAVALHESRDDRVQWALARLEHVWVIAVEREEGTAVLQREAGARWDEPGAERMVHALNQGHDVAVAVDGREIDRIAAGSGRDAGKRR